MTEQPEGPQEIDDGAVEFILTQEQMDAIEHLLEHYEGMLGSLAVGAMTLQGEHRDIMAGELLHMEQVLLDVAKQWFPEKHDTYVRAKHQAQAQLRKDMN